MQTILITGTNRGIGLELTRQLLQRDDVHLFATCRTPERADQLSDLARKHPKKMAVLKMDVNDASSIDSAVAAISAETRALDLLINNAGIAPRGDHQSRDMGDLSAADLSEVIITNAVGPLIVTQACRDLLKAGDDPRVVMISSSMGSLQRAGGSSYGYRMSKAAMNMAARVLAYDTSMTGIITITANPGWVKTDMGGPSANLTPEQSASALLALIDRLTPSDNGKFFQYDGTEIPW